MVARDNSKVVHKDEVHKKPTPQSLLQAHQLEKEDLAPDGGWGWMIAIGMIIASLVTICQGSSFGLLFGDFLEASGNGGSALVVINLMVMVSLSATGLICNELLKRYSKKSVGLVGSVIYASANTLACLVPNVTCMAIVFFMQGIGVSLMMTVCSVSFNAYFVKRRTKVMGASQVIIGLGGIIYPSLTANMLSAYGFRGCLALMGAISLNGVAVMLLMDPVEWHYKKPKILVEKTSAEADQEIGSQDDNCNLTTPGKEDDSIRRHSMDVPQGWEKNRSVRSLRGEADHESPLLIEALKASHRSQDRNGSALDIGTGSRLRPGKSSSLDLLANKLSMSTAASISSINGISGFNQTTEISVKDADGNKKKSIRSTLADFFEVSLLRDGTYVNMSIGSGLNFLTDILFNAFLPMIMSSKGYTKSDIALTLTVAAIAELLGKLLFAVFAMFVDTKARRVFLFSVYCLVACRTVFLYCNTLTSILIVHGFSGAARSLSQVNHTLIFAEHVKIERFQAAWTIFTVIIGCLAVIYFPLVGFLKDWTESYAVAQYVLLGGLLTCLIPWTIEILIHEIFANKKPTDTVNRN